MPEESSAGRVQGLLPSANTHATEESSGARVQGLEPTSTFEPTHEGTYSMDVDQASDNAGQFQEDPMIDEGTELQLILIQLSNLQTYF